MDRTDKKDNKKPPEEERFHSVLVGMIDFLAKIIEYTESRGHRVVSPLVLVVGREVILKYNKHDLTKLIIKRSEEYWDGIYTKDEEFFISKADIVFAEFKSDNVAPFKILFTAKDEKGGKLVGQDNRDALWKFIHSMVKICIQYASKNGVIPKDKLSKHISKWEIKM